MLRELVAPLLPLVCLVLLLMPPLRVRLVLLPLVSLWAPLPSLVLSLLAILLLVRSDGSLLVACCVR
jgi:hypothetical protein